MLVSFISFLYDLKFNKNYITIYDFIIWQHVNELNFLLIKFSTNISATVFFLNLYLTKLKSQENKSFIIIIFALSDPRDVKRNFGLDCN